MGDPNDIVADFDLGSYQLRPGMLLTVNGGGDPGTLTLRICTLPSSTWTMT